ncbi:hypothetical protein G3A_12720 [Bacillus sp. 17376]|nr:hypothetical protein G3A_12720 [Bacillus sp. 17376]
MSDYIKEIRILIGTRPFILVGSAVLVFNRQYEVLLQLRTDTGKWGIPGGSLGRSLLKRLFSQTLLLFDYKIEFNALFFFVKLTLL